MSKNYQEHPYTRTSELKQALESLLYARMKIDCSEDILNEGTLLHTAFLEPEKVEESVIICKEKSRASLIKEDSEYYSSEGESFGVSYNFYGKVKKKPVFLEKVFNEIVAKAKRGRENLIKGGLDEKLEWIEREFYCDKRELKCKIDATYVNEKGERVLIDLKSVNLSLFNHKKAFYVIENLSYDLQMANYMYIINDLVDEKDKIKKAEIWFLSKDKASRMLRVSLGVKALDSGTILAELARRVTKKEVIAPHYHSEKVEFNGFSQQSIDARLSHYFHLHRVDIPAKEDEVNVIDDIDSNDEYLSVKIPKNAENDDVDNFDNF